MAGHDDIQREALPIPDRRPVALYSTARFGKCHEVPVFETTPIGPFHHWPTGSGFEHFYGFIGGENNQYYPALYDGTTFLEYADHHVGRVIDSLADLGILDDFPLDDRRAERTNPDISGRPLVVRGNIDAAAGDADHTIGAEERFLAMARQ